MIKLEQTSICNISPHGECKIEEEEIFKLTQMQNELQT